MKKLSELDLSQLLAGTTDDSITISEGLDMKSFPNEKIQSQFLLVLMDAIADRLFSLKTRYSENAILAAIKSIFEDDPNELAKSLIEENLSKIHVDSEGSNTPITNYETWEQVDKPGKWDKFLLFLGIAPWYAPSLETYFGEDEDSLGLLLKSINTGYLDPLVLKDELKGKSEDNDSRLQ
jgi:hypothetical protein